MGFLENETSYKYTLFHIFSLFLDGGLHPSELLQKICDNLYSSVN